MNSRLHEAQRCLAKNSSFLCRPLQKIRCVHKNVRRIYPLISKIMDQSLKFYSKSLMAIVILMGIFIEQLQVKEE